MARRLLPYGERGLLLECADLTEALGLLRALQAADRDEVAEIVPGARTLFLRTTGRPSRPLQQALLDLAPLEVDNPDGDGDNDGGGEVVIGVHYDGDDLAEVAELTGLSTDQVVAAHTGQRWTVGFCGFAPGFGYLYGEHERLRVPRRDQPRTVVPSGAVGLADVWSGVYPRPGPGGWQLIGRTDETLWDLASTPPTPLRPGVRVRFVDRDAR